MKAFILTKQRCRRQLHSFARAIELPLPDAGFQSGFYIPINDVVLSDSGVAQVVANGNLALSWVGSTFAGTLDANDQLDTLNAGIELNGAATIELALEAGADLARSLRLAMIPLPPFSLGAIQVSPYVQVKLHFDVTADSAARMSMVAPFRIGSHFSNNGSPQAGLSSPPRYDPEVGLPDAAVNFASSIELEIVVALLLTIEGFAVGGPVIGVTNGVILAIDSATGWDLDGLVKVVGGWAFLDPVTLLPDIPERLRLLHPPSRYDIASAAGPFPVGAVSTRWSRIFDIANDDSAVAALPAEDGLYVVSSGPNPWLAKLDSFGVPLWQITGADAWHPVGMVSAANGDLLVAGTYGNNLRIDRFDSSGGPLWTRTLSVVDGSRTTCVALVQTAANSTILAGAVTHSSVDTPILLAVDEQGNVLWSSEVNMGAGSTNPVINALAETPTGEILAVGTVEYTNTSDPSAAPIDHTNALILKLDPAGTLLSAAALGGTADEQGLRIAVHSDGSYAIGGHRSGSEPNVWIATLNGDDTLRWSATYQSRPDDSNIDEAEPTGLATIAGNGLLVAGWIGSPNQDAFLLRLNDEGTPVWGKSYMGADSLSLDELAGVIALPNGLVAFGRTDAKETTPSSEDLWIMRTNVDGFIDFTPDSGLSTVNTAVQWQRISDHAIYALAPTSVVTTLTIDPNTNLVVNPSSALGELITVS